MAQRQVIWIMSADPLGDLEEDTPLTCRLACLQPVMLQHRYKPSIPEVGRRLHPRKNPRDRRKDLRLALLPDPAQVIHQPALHFLLFRPHGS